MQLTQSIEGKIALITGGSSGLGQATAVRLAGAGVRVYALGRNRAGLEATAKTIEDEQGFCASIQGDLAERGVAEAAVQQVVAAEGQIDILVNNAGVMLMDAAATGERDRWEEMFNINVLALIEGSQAAIAAMRKTKNEGHIVNISSLASRLPGGGVYGATKAAVERYADQLRLELEGDDIRITTIVPGGFSTNLGRNIQEDQQAKFQATIGAQIAGMEPDEVGRTPLFGIPDDIARAVVFAVAQPIYLNVFELVIRPAKNIDPAAFNV